MTAVALAVLLPLQESDIRSYDVPLDALYDAAYRGAAALDMRVETTTKDALEGTYRGFSAEGRAFLIRLVRTGENTTRAEVAVEDDLARAARLHDALRALTAD